MLPQPLTGRTDGVGEVFRTNTRAPRHHPPPSNFLRTVIFFENKTRWKREIFMARPPKPPAYLDELAAQQWKAKAKQLAERGDLTPADWNNLELFLRQLFDVPQSRGRPCQPWVQHC